MLQVRLRVGNSYLLINSSNKPKENKRLSVFCFESPSMCVGLTGSRNNYYLLFDQTSEVFPA